MTESELETVESALNIRLPKGYRDVMLNYPFPPDSWPDQAEIPNNPTYLIALNLELRADSLGPLQWTRHFAFGGTSDGHLFAFDSALACPPVLEIDRQSHQATTVAGELSSWVALRVKWYVEFDCESETKKYARLVVAVHEAGFHVAPVCPMGGWDRVCPASKRSPNGAYTGNSFWVSRIGPDWFLGTWGGWIYRIDGDHVASCTVDWLRRGGDRTRADFDDRLKREFALERMSDEDFDAAVALTVTTS